MKYHWILNDEKGMVQGDNGILERGGARESGKDEDNRQHDNATMGDVMAPCI